MFIESDPYDCFMGRSRLRSRLLGVRPDGRINLVGRAWAVKGVVPSARQ